MSRGNALVQIGAPQYCAQLRLPDKGLVVCHGWDQEDPLRNDWYVNTIAILLLYSS